MRDENRARGFPALGPPEKRDPVADSPDLHNRFVTVPHDRRFTSSSDLADKHGRRRAPPIAVQQWLLINAWAIKQFRLFYLIRPKSEAPDVCF